MVGRPSIYNKQLVDYICEQVSQGKSLRQVAKQDGMPARSTIFAWLYQNRDFSDQYRRAKEFSADAMAEDILDIADENDDDWMEVGSGNNVKTVVNREAVERSKLRVHARTFLMGKMQPKRYGDKLDVTTKGEKLPTPILGGASIAPLAKQAEKQP